MWTENKDSYEKKDRIESLQTVRALAFLGIFLAHCVTIQPFEPLGPAGVSVFFVLSGFLMAYTYYDKLLDTSIKKCIKFSLKKIKKLYPLHIITMLLASVFVVESLISDFSLKHLVRYSLELFLNATLLQTWIPRLRAFLSFNFVSWYLSVCLFLYAMFPVIIKHLKNKDLKRLFLIVIEIYCFQIVLGALTQSAEIPFKYFDSFSYWFTYIFPLFRLGDFAIGCCVGIIFLKKRINISGILASCCEILVFIAIAIAVYIYANNISFFGSTFFKHALLFTPISIGLVTMFAINKGILSKILTCKPLIYIGNLSPYAFLLHPIVNNYLGVIFAKINIELNIFVMGVVAFAITIICSEIYIHIERAIKKEVTLRQV